MNSSALQQRLDAAGLVLQPPGSPVASYVPFVITGKLVYVSGHIAKQNGEPCVGPLGRTMNTEAGYQAARSIAVDLLGTLQAAAGDLSNVARIVKLLCLVNSTADFTEHHIVANGTSDLLEEILGDVGKSARSAFGVAQIPSGACVEVELIAELR